MEDAFSVIAEIDWGIELKIISKINNLFPFRGIQNWALCCALLFIASQLMWTIARTFRSIDWLELPLRAFYFPLAAFVDPRDWMIHQPAIYFCAIGFWIVFFFVGQLFTRKRMNPFLPMLLFLMTIATSGIVYSIVTKPRPEICY